MYQLMWCVVCAVAVSALADHTNAQQRPAEDPLRLFVDYSRFRGDDEHMFIEVYYGFPQSGLIYVETGQGYSSGLDLTVLVEKGDSIVYADRWLVPHEIKDTAEIKRGMNLVGVTSFGLRDGDYVLKLIGRDRHDASSADTVSLGLPVKLIGSKTMALSDIELASDVKPGEKGTPFYKNTLEVIPNVEGVFTEQQRCFYYVEAYNLLEGDDKSDYFVTTTVFDAVGREVISRERPRKRTGESSVIVDNIAVGRLMSGTYTLVVSLLDAERNRVSSSGKRFWVYNSVLGVDTTMLASDASVLSAEYAGMDEAALDKEFAYARHTTTAAERSQYSQLQGVDGKRKFMATFWTSRPLGFKEEYLKRVGYANQHFRALGREGYRSDRGRVHIVYGPPDDIDRHPNESEMRPYEIWSYNSIQGGVIFVFVMRQSDGDYELVHSTHRNELNDENWSRYAIVR
jgi:GWxTD domain-containing protein